MAARFRLFSAILIISAFFLAVFLNSEDDASHQEELKEKEQISNEQDTVSKAEKMNAALASDLELLSREERIEISVPWSKGDEPTGFTPVGETVYHDLPGHPGVDFGWVRNVTVQSSAAGKVTNIVPVEPGKEGNWVVEITSGDYIISYNFLEDILVSLGQDVKKGGAIGYPGFKGDGGYVIHWDIRPDKETEIVITERLCPLTYFDNESRQTIEAIYAKHTWMYKDQFPKVCNGFYDGLDSFIGLYNRSFTESGERVKPNGEIVK